MAVGFDGLRQRYGGGLTNHLRLPFPSSLVELESAQMLLQRLPSHLLLTYEQAVSSWYTQRVTRKNSNKWGSQPKLVLLALFSATYDWYAHL